MKLGGGGPKAPTFKTSSGSNTLANAIVMANMRSGIKQGEQDTLLKNVGETKDVIAGQFGGKTPVGTMRTAEGGISVPLNRAYTGTEPQDIGNADMISTHIKNIRSFMQSDPKKFENTFKKATLRFGSKGTKGQVFGIPTTMRDPDAAKLSFDIKDMGNRLVYLFSGKQINESEMARLQEA